MPGLVPPGRSQVQFNKSVMWIHFILGVSHEMMKRIRGAAATRGNLRGRRRKS